VHTLAPDVPPELAAVCACALERNPERRYPSARQMRTDLERIIIMNGWEANALALERLMAQLFDDQERAEGIISLFNDAPPTQVDPAPPLALRLASTVPSSAIEPARKPKRLRLMAAVVMVMAVLSLLDVALRHCWKPFAIVSGRVRTP
jgi:hypothetical protein